MKAIDFVGLSHDIFLDYLIIFLGLISIVDPVYPFRKKFYVQIQKICGYLT